MKKILSAMRRAVQDFDMIADGDKIAVGISGGKDSLILFESLYRYSKFSPEKFSLIAVNVNMGFKETSQEELARLREYFREKEVPFFEEKTDIAEIIFDIRKESNPCSRSTSVLYLTIVFWFNEPSSFRNLKVAYLSNNT